jgi:hypothetical protein
MPMRRARKETTARARDLRHGRVRFHALVALMSPASASMVMAVIAPLFRMSLELQLKLWMLMRHNAWRHHCCRLPLWLPFGHQAVLELVGDHPDVGWIGEDEACDHSNRHHAPEQELGRLHRTHVATHHQKAHDGGHTRHHEIHADEFGDKALSDVLPVSPAHHRFHEQRLEDK